MWEWSPFKDLFLNCHLNSVLVGPKSRLRPYRHHHNVLKEKIPPNVMAVVITIPRRRLCVPARTPYPRMHADYGWQLLMRWFDYGSRWARPSWDIVYSTRPNKTPHLRNSSLSAASSPANINTNSLFPFVSSHLDNGACG
jgi:hypothetical protein